MKKFDFKNKTVIITGASSGIGEALAYELSKLKASVVLAARNEEKLNQVKEKIIHNNGEAIAIKTDVTRKEDCKSLIKKNV